jgi:CheY-like chemotaxis protein
MTLLDCKSTVVIIAEDDPDDRMLIEDAINQACRTIAVKFVQDGNDLLDYLCHRGKYSNPALSPQPELVLLDLNMPKMGGMEVLAEIKRDIRLRSIPVVVLTTSRSPEQIALASRLGANGFITKPPSFNELVSIMETLNRYWFQTVRLPVA